MLVIINTADVIIALVGHCLATNIILGNCTWLPEGVDN